MKGWLPFYVWLMIGLLLSCSQEPARVIVNKGLSFKQPDFSYKKDINNLNPFRINVTQGDTLYSIGRKFHIPIRKLIEVNELRAPYQLHIGQQIKLPQATYHITNAGDTLYDIARGYDVSLQKLTKYNHLSPPYTIKVGQKLYIPLDEDFENKDVAAIDAPNPVPTKPNTLHTAKFSSQRNIQSKTIPSPHKKPTKSAAKVPFIRFEWPIKGPVISRFGPKKGGLYNDGINIAAKEGEDVKASATGVVVYAGNELRGYGNLILIKHPNGYLTGYAHSQLMLVKKGDNVQKGEVIAKAGRTGHVTKPQLHFSIRKGRKAVDPSSYL